MKSYADKNVLCPFYSREEPTKLFCEGVVRGTSLNLNFRDTNLKVSYKNKLCKSKYHDCLLCKALTKKYYDEEKK